MVDVDWLGLIIEPLIPLIFQIGHLREEKKDTKKWHEGFYGLISLSNLIFRDVFLGVVVDFSFDAIF